MVTHQTETVVLECPHHSVEQYKINPAELTFSDIGHDFISAVETPGVNGGRYSGKMEDRLVIAHDPTRKLSADNAAAMVHHTFREAAHDAKTHIMGSTGTLLAITHDKHIVGTNVGDSPAFIIHENADGTLGSMVLHADHSAENEAARIANLGGDVQVQYGRLKHPTVGNLALGRAFGDAKYRPSLIDDPHFFKCDLAPHLTDGRRAWVFVASDGITAHNLDEHIEAVKGLVDQHRKSGTSLNGLLKAHMQQAFHDGTSVTQRVSGLPETDNISIAVAQVSERHQGTSLLGIADGHGGHEVADIVQSKMQQAAKSMHIFEKGVIPGGVHFISYDLPGTSTQASPTSSSQASANLSKETQKVEQGTEEAKGIVNWIGEHKISTAAIAAAVLGTAAFALAAMNGRGEGHEQGRNA